MKTMYRVLIALILAFVIGFSVTDANALNFSASSGTLSASADFQVSGTQLTITLTNTSPNDVLVPADILTAIFFDITGSPNLTKVSALLAPGSTVFYDPDGQPAGGVIGGEWAYKSGLSGAPGGAKQGISSTGVSLFGPGDLFPGPNLAGPASPNGANYGILSDGDNPNTGNGGVTGSGGLIKNSVVFTLELPAGFQFSNISNVSFQYGTCLSEPNIRVPEPSTLLLLGSGLIGLGILGRKRFNRI